MGMAMNAVRGQGPQYKVHVQSQSNLGLRVQTDTPGGAVASFGGNGDFQIDGPGVVAGRFLVQGDGRVGVGTGLGPFFGPLAKLEIRGGADGAGDNDPRAMAFQYAGGGYRHWMRTRHNQFLGNGNAFDFFVNNSEFFNGSTAPGTGSLHVMTLDSGRVGIGTTNPTQTLTVVGKVQSTTGGFMFPDGSVQTNAGDTYTKALDQNLQMSGSSSQTIVQVDVPTGTYALTASVQLTNLANFPGQDNSRFFNCNFSGESLNYGGLLPANGYLALTMHTVLNVSSGSVGVICRVTAHADPTSVFVRATRLTAVKVGGTLNVQ